MNTLVQHIDAENPQKFCEFLQSQVVPVTGPNTVCNRALSHITPQIGGGKRRQLNLRIACTPGEYKHSGPTSSHRTTHRLTLLRGYCAVRIAQHSLRSSLGSIDYLSNVHTNHILPLFALRSGELITSRHAIRTSHKHCGSWCVSTQDTLTTTKAIFDFHFHASVVTVAGAFRPIITCSRLRALVIALCKVGIHENICSMRRKPSSFTMLMEWQPPTRTPRMTRF